MKKKNCKAEYVQPHVPKGERANRFPGEWKQDTSKTKGHFWKSVGPFQAVLGFFGGGGVTKNPLGPGGGVYVFPKSYYLPICMYHVEDLQM